MSKWLRSGLRRDICIVVASEDEPTAQHCKATLEAKYDARIEPKTFYSALEALTGQGYLTSHVDGVADRYELTAAGEQALRDHCEWMGQALSD
ncbi:PadR family transcriptional regulator [Haloplanus halobius]|uniref:PadR family transcriptional regulator n=1 Tax=Haloplanus halobius TaxID=2934938 RepID=UPI00200C3F20|nr:PadR family transcriptional regulator [Haloplanus sp. XH21]